MFLEKALSTKDLLTAIQGSWNHFDKKDCFELMKSMLEKIKAVVKTLGGVC